MNTVYNNTVYHFGGYAYSTTSWTVSSTTTSSNSYRVGTPEYRWEHILEKGLHKPEKEPTLDELCEVLDGE